MNQKIYSIFSVLIAVLSFSTLDAQNAAPLPRTNPETENVSSAGILRFIEAAEKSKNELHSLMILRHGKVIAEGWWDPYKPALRHSQYSISKTFTSTAVGLAVGEDKLKLSDKVISFFPNDLPGTISPNLAALTVRDLLIMSAGQDPDPTFDIGSKSRNWVKAFLATPIVYKPGTIFLYNSMASYILSAIVQKVTGQKIIDYLRPRLFDPLGISGMDWEENMLSVNTGGWGLRLKIEDMAKVGQLYLQKGNWNGNQILTTAWIEEASTEKIFRHPELPKSVKDTSDWEQGYGYQIWRCRYHAYRADGAYGQYIIVLPDLDAVIAIQSETPDMQDELNMVWEYLLPAFKKGKIPLDQKSLFSLQDKLTSLSIPPKSGSASALTTNYNFNRNYILEPNESHLESLVIQIKDSICHFIMNTGSDTYNLLYGSGKWKTGQTNKAGPSMFSYAKENYALLSPYKVAGSYYWKDGQTLVMEMRYLETPHMEITTCHFDGKKISVDVEYSLDFGKKKTVYNGVWK
jgi:CubicO group peptidase (beta-lactamase class C family)